MCYLLEPRKLKDVVQTHDLNQKRSDIAWKPDGTLLAMGNEDGSVMLLIIKHSYSTSYCFSLFLSI